MVRPDPAPRGGRRPRPGPGAGPGANLRRLRTEDGAELFDLPDGALPDPDTPAPVRFLPEYDNGLLGYADRSRVVADAPHAWLQGGPGGHIGSVLVDGFVSATWALRRSGPAARLEVRQSLPLTPAQRARALDEAALLLDFVAPGAEPDVQFTGG